MSWEEADQRPDVVTGTFLVYNMPACVLFDSGATISFVSCTFVSKTGMRSGVSVNSVITLPSGEEFVCSREFKEVPITIEDTELRADLKEFPLSEFDVILGMDWLAKYQANIRCRDQAVTLRGPLGKRVSYSGIRVKPGIRIVSA